MGKRQKVPRWGNVRRDPDGDGIETLHWKKYSYRSRGMCGVTTYRCWIKHRQFGFNSYEPSSETLRSGIVPKNRRLLIGHTTFFYKKMYTLQQRLPSSSSNCSTQDYPCPVLFCPLPSVTARVTGSSDDFHRNNFQIFDRIFFQKKYYRQK